RCRAFSVGPPPNRTCPVKWHPALQCSPWLPCGTSGVDVLVAAAADDEGLAVAGSHPYDPFQWVLAAPGVEVFEGAHVVHLDLLGRPAQFAGVGQKSLHDLGPAAAPDAGWVVVEGTRRDVPGQADAAPLRHQWCLATLAVHGDP